MSATSKSTTRTYIAIDLKSFYASVECVERGLDPLTTNLVVADRERTEKTICLAVSPSLKAHGIPGRARLFEVVQRLREVNEERRKAAGKEFSGKSYSVKKLEQHPDWEIDYVTALPRMSHYIRHSAKIYNIYLRYIAPEDIHVYSIDEVFIDATSYLSSYQMTAHELAIKMIREVLSETGITATAGIGTNMYLCKIAMDIVAKHIPADKDGVRIAELDEESYRKKLWDHRPLTDFWRVGSGIAQRLSMYGIDTMGKIARCSIHQEELLYKLFGINAELLIDHAWGWEPCTMELVKAYRPENCSMSSGQVLQEAYTYRKARVVVQEMADAIALDLVEKRCVADQLVLSVGYDRESLTTPTGREYTGPVSFDRYGRKVPKRAHGSINLHRYTSSSRLIGEAILRVYDDITDKRLLIRRLSISTNHVISEDLLKQQTAKPIELDMFTDYEEIKRKKQLEDAELARERKMQETILKIKHRFGKNSLLRGLNFDEGATAKERNKQIGGHKA
ncbi:Y-family DNA polymerase [Prevotella jejuni]